jgi:3-hydroxyisobutyrate dehydrogenase
MGEIVGVIGSGRMGLPLIGHLARKGFRTYATDLDASKRAKVEERGAAWAANAIDLAAASEVVLVCVDTTARCRSCSGIRSSLRRRGRARSTRC